MIESVIEKIFVDNIGWIYSDNGKIDIFRMNGEMAEIIWFRQILDDGSIKEFNSKYVVTVERTVR